MSILPPLPPVPGQDDALPGGRSILAVLEAEHRTLGRMYATLADADPADPQLGALTSVLVATTMRHLTGEEQYLYPTVRATLPDGAAIASREVNADEALQYALRRLENGPADDLRGLEEVNPALHLHIERCEREIFPALAELVSAEDLIRLGNRVEIAEEAAPTRPHPGTPAAPPMNKVVDPLLGVVDKMRDALGGRTTYPDGH